MIRATDFLKTAKFLSNSQNEWDTRTSISRSYYAVFLEVREFVIKKCSSGKDFPSDKHGAINRCLIGCTDKSWRKIALNLGTLRQNRTDADYKIDKFFNQKNSETAIAIADKLLIDYQANLENSTLVQDFREAIKKEFQSRYHISI
jgi:uncharacterized protein (UPF0332 family)